MAAQRPVAGSTSETSLPAFVAETEYADVPGDVATTAKRTVVDELGVALAGVDSDVGRIVTETLSDLHVAGTGGAPVLGTDLTASVPDAALANATIGHAQDFNRAALGIWHPGVTVVSPLLSVAAVEGASGREFLTAVAVGVETMFYVGLPVLPSHYERGWHATSTLGTFGAAAAAASLLGLSEEQTANALGIAASKPSGLFANFGTMTKPLHAGHAARSGVTSAYLARNGFTASPAAVGPDGGFMDLYGGAEEADPTAVQSLGEEWAVEAYGLTTKKYPCCSFTHSPIAAAAGLTADHDVDSADVERVEVSVSAGGADCLPHGEPDTGLEGKFSMQHTVASAIADESVTLQSFTEAAVRDEKRRRLQERVSFSVDPDLEYNSHRTRVRITLTDGETLERVQAHPPGSPENPLSERELRTKFADCLAFSPVDANGSAVVDRLLSLEEEERLDGLVSEFSAGE